MADDIGKQQIQDELKSAGLSRRGFIDRIKALGLGFGAAVALGVEGAEASNAPATSVNIKSTNPALDNIINEGRKEEVPAAGEKKIQEAWYRRWGGYSRFWGYRRWYRRW
ncbi:MAG: hypothetical protein ACLPID_06930 [Beijerinckiaceae bacterium]